MPSSWHWSDVDVCVWSSFGFKLGWGLLLWRVALLFILLVDSCGGVGVGLYSCLRNDEEDTPNPDEILTGNTQAKNAATSLDNFISCDSFKYEVKRSNAVCLSTVAMFVDWMALIVDAGIDSYSYFIWHAKTANLYQVLSSCPCFTTCFMKCQMKMFCSSHFLFSWHHDR